MPLPSALVRGIPAVCVALLLGGLRPAGAAPSVIWLGSVPPSPEIRAWVEDTTGPVAHLPGSALAWPAHAPGLEEASALRVLRDALDDARVRWEAFDVERGIVWQIGKAVQAVIWLGGEEDRALLREALILQGSALYWAFPPDRAGQEDAAIPFLFPSGEDRWNGPWVDALALDPDRAWTRADFPDQTSYEAFLQLRSRIQALPPARLTAPDLAQGMDLVVDGRPVADPATATLLPPGHHRVQVVRSGEIAGPGLLWLAPGETRMLAGVVSGADLDRAGRGILTNHPRTVPDGVKAGVDAWRRTSGSDPAWLAAWQGHGTPALLALTGDDPWVPVPYPDPWLGLLEARLGAGCITSDSFVEADLDGQAVPAGSVGFSGEFVWRSFVLKAEIDALGGAGRIAYGTSEVGTDRTTPVWVRFAAAPGLYIVPPRPWGWPWHVALPVGLLTPAHVGGGLETGLGIPMGPNRWVRATLDLWFGSARSGFRGSSATTAVLRVGYAWKLR